MTEFQHLPDRFVLLLSLALIAAGAHGAPMVQQLDVEFARVRYEFPVVEPFTENPYPGARFGLLAGSAFTASPYATGFGTATQSISLGGTTGGAFWTRVADGWSLDARQVDGSFSLFIGVSAPAGLPVSYPADAVGMAFTTGLTLADLDDVDVTGQFRIVGADAKSGAFNLTDDDLVTDATGRNFFYRHAADFEPFTLDTRIEDLFGATSRVELLITVTPRAANFTNVLHVLGEDSFGVVSLAPVPVPAALPLLLSALGGTLVLVGVPGPGRATAL